LAPDRRRHVHLARQDDADRDPHAPRWLSSSGSTSLTRCTAQRRSTRAPIPRSATRNGRSAERLISELSETEFQPEKYEDEYRQRLLKAIEYAGDLLHHSAQCRHPDWCPAFDLLPEMSAASRRRILERAMGARAFLLTAHLPTPGIARPTAGGEWQTDG
jgi:hypothetical protein